VAAPTLIGQPWRHKYVRLHDYFDDQDVIFKFGDLDFHFMVTCRTLREKGRAEREGVIDLGIKGFACGGQ
jgi:hypothetical protein